MMTEALREGLAHRQALRGLDARGHGARARATIPEMGEDFLEQRLAMRVGAAQRALPSRIADGRWVRVRENRTEDGSRVLARSPTSPRSGAAPPSCACWRWRWSRPATRWRSPAPTTASPTSTTPSRPRPATAPAEALGREPQDILSSGMQPPEFFAEMRRELEAGRRWQGTIINRHRDGHLIEQETTIAPLARRERAHHALRGGQARRDRGAGAGAGAGGERGALPRGGGRADRVHRAGRAGRLLDLHERGGGALRRPDAGGDARAGACATPT